MAINPGFTWNDIVTGLNNFMGLGPVSAILVAVIVLGLASWLAGALRSMVSGD